MNRKAPLNQLRRIFFTPIDEQRIEAIRRQHDRTMNQQNIINLR